MYKKFIYIVIKTVKKVDFVVISFTDYEKARAYADKHNTRKEAYRVEMIALEDI